MIKTVSLLKITITILIQLIPFHSFSYIGPGMGGGFIAATIGIVVAILATIFGLIYFPIKRFFKKKKRNKKID